MTEPLAASGPGAVAADEPLTFLWPVNSAGTAGFNSSSSEAGWWDALQAARAARASAALAARGPEEGGASALPPDVWALIKERAATCR